MTVKSSWLTEKEICDQIWIDPKKNLNQALPYRTNNVRWYREYELIDGEYRADFVGFGERKNKLEIFVVEAKITADIYSVSQLTEYLNIFENTVAGMNVNVNGLIVARYFDKSVYPLASYLGLTLIRVFTEKKKIGLGLEDGYQNYDFCKQTLLNLKTLSNKTPGVTNGEAPHGHN